jgi:hypothetical protein
VGGRSRGYGEREPDLVSGQKRQAIRGRGGRERRASVRIALTDGELERYVEIAGRVMALVVGTFAIEMIMRGLETWSGIIVVD